MLPFITINDKRIHFPKLPEFLENKILTIENLHRYRCSMQESSDYNNGSDYGANFENFSVIFFKSLLKNLS